MVPYEGKEPYIFISYAHKDSDVVLPIIETMADYGFRVWYDAGIEAGTEWPEYIAERLDGAAVVIAFLSEHALKSINCRQEINESISLEKDLLVVHLHEVELTKGMRMRLSLTQAMFMYRHESQDSFIKALFNAKILIPCLEKKEQVVKQPIAPVVESDLEEQVQEPVLFLRSNPDDFVIDNGTLNRYVGKGGVVLVPEGMSKIGLDENARGIYALFDNKLKFGFEKNKDITEVVITEGVEYIGHMAFYGCENLARIRLPKTLKKIEKHAFLNCFKLKQLEIPEDSQLQFIGESAFENCSSLENLSLPKTLNHIGKNAFRACRSLQSVRLPLDGNLGIVTEDAFFNCSSLEKVTLPKHVTTINERAFYGCESLWDINMPQSLAEIKEAAFKKCEKLESVDCAWLGILQIIGKEAFSGCRSLKTVSLPNTVASIDEDAFAGCVSLDHVEIPRKTKMPMFRQVFPKNTVVKRV